MTRSASGCKGHGRSQNFVLKKASCPTFDNKCKQCMRKGHFQDFCNRKPPKDKPEKDGAKDNDKAGSKSVKLWRVQVSKGLETNKKWEFSKSNVRLMKKQQKMTKLGHEEWSAEFQTYVKREVPKEPDLKIRMCLDIKDAKHKPPLECCVTEKWEYGLQVNVKLTSTADTGAQVNVLGTDYLEGFGLEIKHLLRTRMELNCANAAPTGMLGVFYARIKGKHYKTGNMIETKAMLYVIEGDVCLLSRKTLKPLGCLPGGFPRVGELLEAATVKSIEPVDTGDGQDGDEADNSDQTHLNKRERS
jgi:hypothetical protein